MGELVVGMGEVGKALAAFLGVPGRDIDPTDDQADVIHIAIPYSDDFSTIVKEAADCHGASLVIVHSTVAVGTCDPHGWVHSPVRGRHPQLLESLGLFHKLFGGERAGEVDWPGPRADVSTAAETELGKLWELAQFGLQVRVNQAITEHCLELGIDPLVVYDLFAHTYNIGYQKLGDERFMRPVLDYVPGDIGGHCVGPSMGLLDHRIARIVEEGL